MGTIDDLFDDDNAMDVVEGLEKALGGLVQSTQRFALETAEGRSRDRSVRVWVNAQNMVVQVEFDDDVFTDSTPAELQTAIVEAAQAAGANMQEKADAFQVVARRQAAEQLGIDEESPAEFGVLAKLRPTAPLTPPNSPERRTTQPTVDRSRDRPHVSSDDELGEWRLRITD